MTQAKKWPTTRLWPRWLLAFSLLAGSSPALAEPAGFQLAQQPEYYEQVYLSEAQALALAFKGLTLEKRLLTPTPAQRLQIERRLRRKLDEPRLMLYVGRNHGVLQRFAFVLNEKGKHFPITFLVALSPQAAVEMVTVMVYRERRGDGVRRQRFLNQFLHKTSRDPIEINNDIIHITGSTISSWSIAAGVRKAVVLLEELVIKPRLIR